MVDFIERSDELMERIRRAHDLALDSGRRQLKETGDFCGVIRRGFCFHDGRLSLTLKHSMQIVDLETSEYYDDLKDWQNEQMTDDDREDGEACRTKPKTSRSRWITGSPH